MAEHHVPLTIDENGMVTKVGHDMGGSYEYKVPANDIFETCIMCGKTTDVLVDTHIDFRYGYVEGAGQCCRDCYQGSSRKLITIDERTILDTPNDSELGSKVRKIYWDGKK